MKKTTCFLIAVSLLLSASAPGAGSRQEDRTRNFVLFFEILDYTKAVGDAVSFFLDGVQRPGDQLIVYTPARAYSFSQATLAGPTRELTLRVQGHLRADTAYCSAQYKVIMEDMKTLVREIENQSDMNSLRRALTLYRQSLVNLQSLRKVDEGLLADIAEMFKAQTGENHIVMTYQAEFRPVPDRETINRLRAMPVVFFEANDLFAETDKRILLDTDLLIEALKESGVAFHFIYIKTKDIPPSWSVKEHSVDMYNAFSRVAAATGGVVETTSRPESALKNLLKTLDGRSDSNRGM